MEELKLYNIDDRYIHYLQETETEKRGFTKVSHNLDSSYKNRKPYVGIILKINDYHYFVPLTHPKEHYDANRQFFNRISTSIKLSNGRDYGRLMYCYMIPLKQDMIPKRIDINQIQDMNYKAMLMTQYFYINSKGKREEIIKKAQALYKKVYKNPEHFLYHVCCDFEMLECACKQYK